MLELIDTGLDKCGINNFKKLIFNYFDHSYSIEIASFIKLILFNIKSNEVIVFYKQVVDLGIVWLICISGFHISLLSRLIKKIFFKIPRVGKYVNIVVIAFYSFLLNFSYASISVLLKLCFDWLFKRYEIVKLNKLGLIGLSICLFNPVCFQSYGFLLSFLICIGAHCIAKLELNNKIINSLLINITAFIVTIPFVVEMNHKIAILSFINAFIFTYFSSFLFIYFIVFA